MKKRLVKTYHAKFSDLNYAISLFKNTPISAYHPTYFPVTIISFISGICFLSAILIFYPLMIRSWILALFSIIIFILPVSIKWLIILKSFIRVPFYKEPDYQILQDDQLPIYSIIIPLFKESKIFLELKQYLECIDYPIQKLDIIFLLEEDDVETIKHVKYHLKKYNPYKMKQLIIPHKLPRTKPKAMNVALNYLKGEYFVIYDAEDRPDPMQLKKAASYFKILPPQIGALQAKLSFYNHKKSLFLSRVFSLEYEIWFNHFLPGLIDLNLPIPLSGTSTHMRTQDIIKIGGWDAYNVTEDCDLGMRLNAAGYQTLILNSTTYEEVVSKLSIWIPQRTRWMKGYLQTMITHLRDPIMAYKRFGLYRLLGIYAIVGGQVFSALLYPSCWVFYLFSFCKYLSITSPLAPSLSYIIHGLMIAGLFLPLFQAILTTFKTRKNYHLLPYALGHSIYWLFASYAAYRALWQLLKNPFLWEKTPHGI